MRPIRLRVPCSTSNLGAGFDCVGLALRRYLHARYTPGQEPLRIERAGTVATLAEDADDLVLRAFRAASERRGRSPGGVIEVESEIPIGRGLGSSGAAIAAGLALAAVAAGERRPSPEALLREGEPLEGHPDNVAAALFGGLVGIYRNDAGETRAFRAGLSDYLTFAFAAPGTTVSTPAARRALPAEVPHAEATRALGRVAALLRGLATGDTDALRNGFADTLHVPYRLPLIPGGQDALRAAEAAGAIAATISGSGSGIIAVCDPTRAAAVEVAMADAFRAACGDDGLVSFISQADHRGATLLREDEP